MTFKPPSVKLTLSVAMLGALAACAPMGPAPTANSPVYTTPPPIFSTVPSNQGVYVEYGRVNNVEIIRNQPPAQQPAAGAGVGAVLGGVAGAAVGSQIGAGNGRTAAIVIGAVGGAVAGNAIEQSRAANVSAGETYRVSVRLDNGAMRAYDMTSYGELRIGDRVRIENGQLYRVL